ncbi:hypothetical protein BDF20DRAFT_845263 [Mycotypha africana]|uniref:uncharacterized protein n=1 Tax=Mycotypha africana TaxID=64632 RepID=UPI0022FFDA50|nr:uncharacterized protein BDF20DRAFT_845263 [Mycotypha africana]KAI8991556.1 hypothetical protein BDF20DRAFT_845263 [Mycotypha africana]
MSMNTTPSTTPLANKLPLQQPQPQQQQPPPPSHLGNHPNMMYSNTIMSHPGMQQQQLPPQQQAMRNNGYMNPYVNQQPQQPQQPLQPNGFPMLAPHQLQQLSPQQLQAYQQQMQQHIQRQQQQQQMMMQQQGFDPRYQQQYQMQGMPPPPPAQQQQQPLPAHPHHPHQQIMMRPMHPQQLQQMQHLQQMQQYRQHYPQQIHTQPVAERPKRPVRNASKKKRYEMSSDEEDDFDLEEDEESESSEFNDSDDEGHSKKKSAGTPATGDAEEDGVMIPMGTKVFERILDYRRNEETNKEELLIKYKNTSFLHVEWVPLKQIEGEHLGKHRVKKFLQKYHQEGEKGEDFSEHLKIDRVIDDGELEDPTTGESRIYYLVKWNGLFYDQCTWETEEDVRRIDSVLLDEFLSRKVISPEKLAPPPARPDPSRFIEYADSPPYKYDNKLRPYQLEGLNWLRFCYYTFRSCILADEMGLGKTVQSVALLNDIYNAIQIRGPFLIIAPLSTIPHWTRAFKAWTDLNVIDFRGSTLARSLIVETEFFYQDMEGKNIPNKYKFDVLITTYEMASAGAMTLKDIPWRCGVFDEAHRLKNKNSKVLEILRTFYMDHKLLLTGTPLQNNLGELYSLLNFMQPEIFNDEARFFAEYGSLNTAQEVEKLQYLLKPIMLRRFKEDVEKTIPVKEETVIEVELTNPQKKWYRAILEKNFSFLRKGSKSNKDMPHLRNIMMQLRKCCIHPYLLEGAEDVIAGESNAHTPAEQFNCLVQSSGKLVLIDKLLRKLIQGNHKVLIFSQFTSCLDILSDYLRGRKYAYERIDGSIPGEQRQAAIDRFSTLPIEESFVFLLCTRAGGVGINLTAADTCIIFDSDWNPQNDLQAQARCHRIGQTKPVQIYRLICANTYEKDMFDRAGMKLGLDKAVMGTHDDGSTNKTAELNRKEIEDLLKKGAYGAMLDEEESTKFCEEDIDQILERRTKIIKHEGNEKGSVFSKATFSAADNDTAGVDLDDPDFWEKWAAKAQIDTTETPEENPLIVSVPRRRRQVQRFGSRQHDGSYSDNSDDSDAAYEDEDSTTGRSSRRGRNSDQVRPWTLSEKTKYERKLMIYGYGAWDQMTVHFSRRSEKDLKAVTRALMRKVLPTLENAKKISEEDRKLIDDIEGILENDADDEEKRSSDSVPYAGATKKQIAEFKSFLIQAPPEYIDHIERKGRNLLLRIQMLHLIRDKIVPQDWEEAKALEIPKVTGSPPASWWGSKEDRDLLLGICKHGYQQYLAMRNDPEFCFYGRKYDDSQSGGLEDDDGPTADNSRQGSVEAVSKRPATTKKVYGVKQDDDDSDYEDKKDRDYESEDEEYEEDMEEEEFEGKKRRRRRKVNRQPKVYVWPSKADIGMRLRRIIAAFLREKASDSRKRRMQENRLKKENERQTRQRQRETRMAQKERGGRRGDWSNRWTKKNKSDFLKTLMSFGVERDGEDGLKWDRFREIAGLDKKSDEALTNHYREIMASCEESVKRHSAENANNATALSSTNEVNVSEGAGAEDTPVSSPKENAEEATSREASLEPNDDNDANETGDLVPFDKARRSIKRVEQMNTIREKVITHEDLDSVLSKARKTSGLPNWWEVPKHDKALLEGICKHGIGRNDLIIEDPELPFYHVKQRLDGEAQQEENAESDKKENGAEKDDAESTSTIATGNNISNSAFVWPRDLVIARRVDSLCDLVLNPKPLTIRQTRKRRHAAATGETDEQRKKMKSLDSNAIVDKDAIESEEDDENNDDETETADEESFILPTAAEAEKRTEEQQTENVKGEDHLMEEAKEGMPELTEVKGAVDVDSKPNQNQSEMEKEETETTDVVGNAENNSVKTENIEQVKSLTQDVSPSVSDAPEVKTLDSEDIEMKEVNAEEEHQPNFSNNESNEQTENVEQGSNNVNATASTPANTIAPM